MGLSNGPGFTPQKPQFFEEKMLWLFMIFFLKNSSPFFLKPWRVGTSNINILLIGAIKNYNFFYCHFLLRPFLSKMVAGPFHQAKAESSSRTVYHGVFLGARAQQRRTFPQHILKLWEFSACPYFFKFSSFAWLLSYNKKGLMYIKFDK